MVQQLSRHFSEGAQVGQCADDKLGFFGVAPVVQPSSANQAAVDTTAATSSSPFGFSEAQANAIVALVNELRANLVSLGLIKGSA